MALYNANLAGSGSSVEIDGVAVDGDLKITSRNCDVSLPNLPTSDSWRCVGGYKGNIHVIGGFNGSKQHYRLVDGQWETLASFPVNCYKGFATEYNGALHVICPSKRHYKWNGSTWTSVTTFPSSADGIRGVCKDNKIYVLAGNTLYSFNGSTWTQVSVLGISFHWNYAFGIGVVNGNIEVAGSYTSGYDYAGIHYVYNGSTWTQKSTPTNPKMTFMYGGGIVCNNKMHLFGGGEEIFMNHYCFNEGTQKWEFSGKLPCRYYQGSEAIVNDEIVILDGALNVYKLESKIYEIAQ